MADGFHIFQEFLDALEGAHDQQSLNDVMIHTLEKLELPLFAYIGFGDNPSDEPPILSNYPAGWAARYGEQGYHRFDGVLETAIAQMVPFSWGSADYLAQLASKPRRIFDEAADFGIKRGLTIPIHDGRNKLATLNIASDEKASSLLLNIEENRHVLHLMGLYFHARARHTLQRVGVPKQNPLSSREIECLQWAAIGKSSYDIAEILSISRRTVVFHRENAKKKLGVVTLHQAITEAFYRGILKR